MISKETAKMLNRLGRTRSINRRALAAAIADDPDPDTIEEPTVFRVVKSRVVAMPGTGTMQFKAGMVVEDPIVLRSLRAAEVELRPIG